MTATAADQDRPDFATLTERCTECGEPIRATSRKRLQRRYTEHVVEEHDRKQSVDRGIRTRRQGPQQSDQRITTEPSQQHGSESTHDRLGARGNA